MKKKVLFYLLFFISIIVGAIQLSPAYKIIVDKDAIPSEIFAAQELQAFIQKTLKIKLRISTEPVSKDKNIFIGKSKIIENILFDASWKKLKADEIIIKTVGDNLIITGQGSRGTLYAVYTFIEDVLGVKFLTSKDTWLPKNTSRDIGELNIRFAPRLQVRGMYYKDVIHKKPLFAARRKINGHFQDIPEKYGASVSWIGPCHTFNRLIPPQKYFKKHPEWFSLRNGKRKGKDSQLCLTNKEMRAELIKNALQWLKESKRKSCIISISQNDNRYFCQCSKCKMLDNKEASHSGSLIHFVNYVAKELAKHYPDLRVKTFAYQYTRKPPKFVKPAKNVIIELCSIENFVNRPMTNECNQYFCRDLELWNNIASQIYIWDYVANFNNYGIPHPNIYFLASNIRYFEKFDKVIRIYEEGDGKNYVGDFNALRIYLLSKIMWNQQLKTQDIIDEFLTCYYGKAASYVSTYIKFIQNLGANSKTTLTCFVDNTSSWLSNQDIVEGLKIFDKALESVKENPVYYRRVREARLTLYFAALDNYAFKKKLADLEKEKWLLPSQKQLMEEIKTLSPQRIFHHGLKKKLEMNLKQKTQKEYPIPEACNAKGKLTFDLQDFTYYKKFYGYAVKDDGASDGIAAMGKGKTKYWFFKYPLSWIGLYEDYNPFKVYALVRCDATGDEGKALGIGIYNKFNRKTVMEKTINISEIRGKKYKMINLGTYPLTNKMYFFGACPNNSTVEKVYVDRIILVSTKKVTKK